MSSPYSVSSVGRVVELFYAHTAKKPIRRAIFHIDQHTNLVFLSGAHHPFRIEGDILIHTGKTFQWGRLEGSEGVYVDRTRNADDLRIDPKLRRSHIERLLAVTGVPEDIRTILENSL